MSIKKYFLLPLGLLVASALPGQTNLLNDSFTSGTTGYFGLSGQPNMTAIPPGGVTSFPGVQNPPTSAFWFGNNSTPVFNTSSAHLVAGLFLSPILYTAGTGITIPNASSTGQSVSANFESPGSYQTLAVGDTLTTSFNFKLGSAATTYTGNSAGIRLLLLNSASTGTGAGNNQITANCGNSRTTGGTNSLLYSGYMVGFDAAASPSSSSGITTIYNKKNGDSVNFIASSPSETLGIASAMVPALNTTDTYQATLTILNLGTTMSLGFSLTDLTTSTALSAYTLNNVTDTGAAPHPLITAFDGLVIGELSSENTPMTISNVNVTYTPEPTAAAPTFGTTAGTYTSAQSVTISSTTPGALIAYTLDGSTPTESGGTVINGTALANGGTVSVGTSLTINAIAFATTPTPYGASPVGTAAYVINDTTHVAQPTFSPGANTVALGTTVTISTTTSEASIRYTTDGSTPSETLGTPYTVPIPISATTTIKAIGYIGGLGDSVVTNPATYTISSSVAAPTFSPGGGAVASGTAVTISCATTNSSIRYTTDGSTPSETLGTLYASPIPITAATTIEAIGFAGGQPDSAVSSAQYSTFVLPANLTPLPLSQVVTSGKTMILTASATGSPTPTFQWEQSTNAGTTWTPIAGQTGSTVTITAGPSLGTVQYRYVATNSGGSVNSTVFNMIVNPALFPSPTCVVVDPSGNLYAGDSANNRIQQIDPSGVVRLVAGSPAGMAGSMDGTGSTALFHDPTGIMITPDASMLYVADTGNSALRQITTGGTVTTLVPGFLSAPAGVAVDTSGNVYVADSTNKVIRMITKAGVGSTFAGPPTAQFNAPYGLAVNNSTGNFYVSDSNTLRQIKGGAVTTLAGASTLGSADGTGSNAGFNSPNGLAVDSTGNIYVADTGNSTIRKVTPANVVTTLAGQAGKAGLLDGTGSNALFNEPEDLTVDASGNVYVADTLNGAIRKITPAGVVTTLVLTTPSSSSPTSTSSSAASSTSAASGGGDFDGWFLGFLAFAGLLRWRQRKSR
jgi:sugar lactone lactonase YvrE